MGEAGGESGEGGDVGLGGGSEGGEGRDWGSGYGGEGSVEVGCWGEDGG